MNNYELKEYYIYTCAYKDINQIIVHSSSIANYNIIWVNWEGWPYGAHTCIYTQPNTEACIHIISSLCVLFKPLATCFIDKYIQNLKVGNTYIALLVTCQDIKPFLISILEQWVLTPYILIDMMMVWWYLSCSVLVVTDCVIHCTA